MSLKGVTTKNHVLTKVKVKIKIKTSTFLKKKTFKTISEYIIFTKNNFLIRKPYSNMYFKLILSNHINFNIKILENV